MCASIGRFFKRLFGIKDKPLDIADRKGKVLLVGINEYADAPLRGCINDIDMFQLALLEKFNVDPKNMRLLLNKEATTKNYKNAMKWLADVKPGEYAIHHFSGHGVQIPSKETDGLDEAVCPYDFDWTRKRMITDDDYFKFFWEMPDDVKFYWTSDSCHSGDLTRALEADKNRTMPLPPKLEPMILKIRARKIIKPLLTRGHAKELDVGFVSACQSFQTAADTVIRGKPVGAFSYFFVESLMRKPKASLKEIVERTARALKSNYYSQIPDPQGPRIKLPYMG